MKSCRIGEEPIKDSALLRDDAGTSREPVTVSAVMLRNIFAEYLAGRSLDWNSLVVAARLSPAQFQSVDARITLEDERRLWREAERQTGDALIGLHAGASVRPAALGVLGYLMQNSANLGEALAVGARYQRFVMTGFQLELEREDEIGRFTVRLPRALVPGSRHTLECGFGALVNFCREATGSFSSPLEVRFQHAAEENRAEASRFFGAPLRYDCERSELVFRSSDLDLPMRRRDPDLLEILEQHAAEVAARLPDQPPLLQQVRCDALEALGRQRVSLHATARRLGFGPRTLQRRLRMHGTSFNLLVDELRRELAMTYLSQSDRDVAEVAFLLGFARPSVFHRAFRRWTGRTPGAFRRGLLSRSATRLT